MRAVWITNVDSDVLFSDEKIAESMDFLADIGINVVFPVVWNKGYTMYPSRVMDSLFSKPIIPAFAGRDPLKKLIIEAHRNGIEVIPWFEFGFSSSYSLNGGHIIAAKPEWAGKNAQGELLVKNGFDWLAGTNPEVQDFLIALTTEVLDNYEVDGVQGDDRLPAMPIEGGYDSVTVAIYKSEHDGADPSPNYYDQYWKKWRADKLSDFLARWRDSVKVRSDNYILSVAPSVYPWSLDNYLQDSKTWLERGLPDNFIPQIYRRDITSYINELNSTINNTPEVGRDKLFAGVLGKSGGYVMTPQLLRESIAENRKRNVMGESLFFYEALRENNNRLGDTLRKIYETPATLPYRGDNLWRPKGFVINEDSTTHTVRTGGWSQASVLGFKPKIYWTRDTSYASFEWLFDIEHPAWYGVYAFFIPNFAFTDSARYTITGELGDTTVVFSQRNVGNKSWVKLGDVYLTPGKKSVLKLDNTLAEYGKYVVADAAMLLLNRDLSPDVVITSVQRDCIVADEIPLNFELSQNFPNPFNPSTVISFSIPETEAVKLKIYDITGREIATLLNETKQAGSYSIEFDAGAYQLASGVYFYSLEAGKVRLTRKMVLLK
ncbi:MAG: family 10 glycosylhydrolase [Ignavibacteriaceae bacterium]|nr:MAG: family 10 glycosylhydrolase [Ignavibacteriaceae bacterium]MBW7871880.1 family 10 glycosylhydrolase [Ignavibacteria bacterium]MBZ0195944.1 family 10 glycosylhydrolase [Ignavibacteriaceae bacterium]